MYEERDKTGKSLEEIEKQLNEEENKGRAEYEKK